MGELAIPSASKYVLCFLLSVHFSLAGKQTRYNRSLSLMKL